MKTIQENRKQCKQALNRFKQYSYFNENTIHYDGRQHDHIVRDLDNNQTTIQEVKLEAYNG